MPVADYTIRAGVGFGWTNSVHPGSLPIHADDANAAIITSRNRAYDANIKEFNEMTKVNLQLKNQILVAVELTFLRLLSDEDFGFADVTPRALLDHLRTTYTDVEPEELEKNRVSLQETWNVEEPIELLWEKITKARAFATRHGDPITEYNALHSALVSIETTGVFTEACDKWRDLPTFGKTINTFRTFFDLANKNRLRKLTAKQGGYHGANAATIPPLTQAQTQAALIPSSPTPGGSTATQAVISDTTNLYYCWSHGLGWNPLHTSALCNNKGEGHKDNATINKMQGGCDVIMKKGRRPNPAG
jgi:hypothetical protein